MMVATLKKCTGVIEDLCQIKYDVLTLSVCHWIEKFCTTGKICKLFIYGPYYMSILISKATKPCQSIDFV